jgi:hypothetical protein
MMSYWVRLLFGAESLCGADAGVSVYNAARSFAESSSGEDDSYGGKKR